MYIGIYGFIFKFESVYTLKKIGLQIVFKIINNDIASKAELIFLKIFYRIRNTLHKYHIIRRFP